MKHIFAAIVGAALALPLVGLVGDSGRVVAAELGDDGLHKAPWMRETFKDLREDLEEANSEGKRLALFFEQRGCVYCTKMHETVFPHPDVASYITENFFVLSLTAFHLVADEGLDGDRLTGCGFLGDFDAGFYTGCHVVNS